MKLLQINTTVNTGSTGRIAEGIGRKALELGHESCIAYGRGVVDSRSVTIRIGGTVSRLMHGAKSYLQDRHGFGSAMATKELIQQIDELHPDIIHLHNLHGYYLHIGYLFRYLKKSNIPVVWTLHDCWSFTGHCAFYEGVNCNKWETGCHDCPLTRRYPSSLGILDNSAKNYVEKKELLANMPKMLLVCPSQWLADEVGRSFLHKYHRVVIPNGVDTTQFRPHNNKEKMILGVANVWSTRKGLKDFVELRKGLDSSINIVLIGLSASQISELPDGMTGISRTENVEELVSWYSRAGIFVNPTYVDNFPTTNLEALACGTPVLTYYTGGSPEAVDESTGWVVPKGDVRAMKHIIETKLSNNNDFDKACRDKAVSQFDAQTNFARYFKHYQNLLDA